MPKKTNKDGISFIALDKSDLKIAAVTTQCLDNTWIPSAFLKKIKGQSKNLLTTNSVEKIDKAKRTEYIRSLIASDQLVINRAFIVNTEIIRRDFIRGSDHRESFKELLNSQAIAVFLVTESSPLEVEKQNFSISETAVKEWNHICHEVEVPCVRLSWNDEANKQAIKSDLLIRFHERLLPLSLKDAAGFLSHLRGIEARIEAEEANAFNLHLRKLRDELNRIQDRQSDPASRHELYLKFVTKGNDTSDRLFDGEKPFMIETKQLIDLTYNTNLSDALQCLTLTPTDSPTRLALQEFSKKPLHDATNSEEIFSMMKDIRFAIIQRTIDFIDFGALSLSDVVAIRRTTEWRKYKDIVEAIVTDKAILSDSSKFLDKEQGVPALEKAYGELLEVLSKHYTHAVVKEKDIKLGVKIVVQVATEFIIALWTQDQPPMIEIGSALTGEQSVSERLGHQAAELTGHIIVGWVRRGGTDLIHGLSLQLSRRRFEDAKTEWRHLVSNLSDPTKSPFKRFYDTSPDEEPATINEDLG